MHKHGSSDQIEENEIYGSYNTHVNLKMHIKLQQKNTNDRDHLLKHRWKDS